jgi:endonuclease/exonuclease/phosphatase family metal-dependent hydrolase
VRPFFLALVALVASAVGSVADLPASSSPRADGTFRVATFNIHKGADGWNRYDLQRTIDAIAALDADVVGLQEVMRNHAAFNCDDQPALIAEGLRRLTGEPWSYVFERSWVWDSRDCATRGRGDGADTEGLAILTPHAVLASRHIRLAESRIGLMARVAAAPQVPVVVTHLASSRRNLPHRIQQISTLQPWLLKHRAGVLMGDFNARPDAVELEPLLAHYRDAWSEALGLGLVGDAMGGSTRPGFNSRIDYILYAADAPVALESIAVKGTWARGERGDVSDHFPVVATFRVRSSQ